MAKAQTTVIINRPIEQVFAFVADFSNEPQWQSGVVKTLQETPGQLQCGSRLRSIRTLMGLRIDAKVEVMEYIPNSLIFLDSVWGLLCVKGMYRFDSIGDGTRLSFTTEIRPPGLLKLFDRAIARQAQKQVKMDFAALKQTLESSVM